MRTINGLTLVLVATSRWTGAIATNLRSLQEQEDRRDLASYYYSLTTSNLGGPNPDAAIGNPLKGLMESPLYVAPPYKADIPLAVEFYYIGLDKIMFGNPNIVGEAAAFDWTVVDNYLSGSASRNMHAVPRVILDFPGQGLKVPQYLINGGLDIRTYSGGISPYYGDPKLLEAMQQFITRFGQRYDGDKRLGFVQAGLLGFWGEWHTFGYSFLPDFVKDNVVGWYASAFQKTQIQVRYPLASAFAAGFGLHDDSFAFETLDGAANGGQVRPTYFWPRVLSSGHGDFWKTSAMGGETRGEIQGVIFDPSYAARTFQKQDFNECVAVTHATYMFHHAAFQNGGYSGAELVNARKAHARMGYNFHVSNVSVKTSLLAGQVDIDVTVTQIGVAPFYYDLNLGLQCPGMAKRIRGGINALIDNGSSKVVGFTGVPSTQACLAALALSLESSYAYSGRPIKFAQGNGAIRFSLPLPGSGGAPVVVKAPVRAPAPAPHSSAQSSIFIDAGKQFDTSRVSISGSTYSFGVADAIGGIGGYVGEVFRHCLWGRSRFSYTIAGFNPGSLNRITMGFAEISQPICALNKRVFSVTVNGVIAMQNLDVYARVGCKKPLTTTRTTTAKADGTIVIELVGSVENPFISFIDIQSS